MEYIVAFPNTHSAILAEQTLLNAGLPAGVMPMPAAISAGCGICLRLPENSAAEAYALLRQTGIPTDGWYRMERWEREASYIPWEPSPQE